MKVTAGRLDGLPDDLSFGGEAWDRQAVAVGEVTPLGRAIPIRRVSRHEPIHEDSNRNDPDPAVIADDYLLLVRQAHLRARFPDRLRGHDSRGLVRVDRVEVKLLADSLEDLLKAFLAELESMEFLRELRHDKPGEPSSDLLQPVEDLLFARRERRRLHGDCERRFRLRLGRLRRGPPRAGGGLGLLALRRRLRFRGGRAEFLEDLLGLLLRDELREALRLRGRELLQGEAGVGQDLRGLLRDPAVPQRLNRRRSGHRHSSDGGSSSSTSTSSSEISTYMSFSVRPYEAISCSRSRSFHDGSSPRTSCKMSSMSTARPWTLRDGSTPSSPNLNWMIVSAVFRTVPSSLTFRSSRALIRRRCMYPDRDVRTAVSTRPSRPPIAWKKYSVGWRPLLYDDFTKPFASAPRSPFLIAVLRTSAICFFASSGMSSSSMPVVKPRIMIAPMAIFVARSMNSRAASGP